jgi:Kinesin motor domain
VRVHDNLIHIVDDQFTGMDIPGSRDKSFLFDTVFSEQIQNRLIYEHSLHPLISNILEGFNVTCFAYGMTGAGKTHTMIGSSDALY